MPSRVRRRKRSRPDPRRGEYRCCTSRRVPHFLASIPLTDTGRRPEMSTQTTNTTEAGRALKARHRALWAFGDYPAVATDLVSELGPVLAGAGEMRRGARVLEVPAGTGNAAIPAAEAGASVVASDLTPELLEAGQRE